MKCRRTRVPDWKRTTKTSQNKKIRIVSGITCIMKQNITETNPGMRQQNRRPRGERKNTRRKSARKKGTACCTNEAAPRASHNSSTSNTTVWYLVQKQNDFLVPLEVTWLSPESSRSFTCGVYMLYFSNRKPVFVLIFITKRSLRFDSEIFGSGGYRHGGGGVPSSDCLL